MAKGLKTLKELDAIPRSEIWGGVVVVGHSGTWGVAGNVVRPRLKENLRMREPRLFGCWKQVISQIEAWIRGIRDRVEDLVKLAFSRYQRIRHFVHRFHREEVIDELVFMSVGKDS